LSFFGGTIKSKRDEMKLIQYIDLKFIKHLCYQIVTLSSYIVALQLLIFRDEKEYLLAILLFAVGFIASIMQHRITPKPKLSSCLEGVPLYVAVLFPIVVVSGALMLLSVVLPIELAYDKLTIFVVGLVLFFGSLFYYYHRCKKVIDTI